MHACKDIAKIAFDILLKDDPDKDIIYLKCFQNSDSKKSWSWVRNRIAHGRIYEGSIGQKYCDEKTIYNIREIAKKLILKSISLNLEKMHACVQVHERKGYRRIYHSNLYGDQIYES